MVERLVKRLHHTDADIYVQLDKKADMSDFAYIAATDGVWFIKKRVLTAWGNYSIIQATLNGLEEILQSGTAYTHINLLSGQDYPLKSIENIHQFLFDHADKNFTSSLSIAGNEWADGVTRMQKYSFGDYNLPAKYKLQALANAILPKRKLPYHLKPYGRSQWLTITPECAAYALSYLKDRPRLKRFFRMTWAVDEVFFQTILENSPLRDKLVNDNLRYIEQEGANRPNIFTIADADKLVASGKLFARKFDTDTDTAIFDRLDNMADHKI